MNIKAILESNLAAIIMGLLAAALAYQSGTTRTADRLQVIEDKLTAYGARQDAIERQRIHFDACLALHVDRLEAHASGIPDCHLEADQ